MVPIFSLFISVSSNTNGIRTITVDKENFRYKLIKFVLLIVVSKLLNKSGKRYVRLTINDNPKPNDNNFYCYTRFLQTNPLISRFQAQTNTCDYYEQLL